MKGAAAVAAEIARRLAAVGPPGSPSAIAEAQLRLWAAEYLRSHDDEVARFPDLAGSAHWNLWMRNGPDGDGLFAVLAFWPHGLDFYCGTGEVLGVRSVSDNALNDTPTALYETLKGLFHIPEEPLRLDRRASEAWLGRPRPW